MTTLVALHAALVLLAHPLVLLTLRHNESRR